MIFTSTRYPPPTAYEVLTCRPATRLMLTCLNVLLNLCTPVQWIRAGSDSNDANFGTAGSPPVTKYPLFHIFDDCRPTAGSYTAGIAYTQGLCDFGVLDKATEGKRIGSSNVGLTYVTPPPHTHTHTHTHFVFYLLEGTDGVRRPPSIKGNRSVHPINVVSSR